MVSLWRYVVPLLKRASAFNQASDHLESHQGPSFPSKPFPTGSGWLNHLWHDYATEYQTAAVDVGGKPVSPVTPESVFTRAAVLRGYNRKTALALAGVFLAIGILGTFWGLVLGLQSVETSTSDQLLTSVTSLLSGMSTAFWSSIAGITVSICWLLLDRWAFRRFRDRVDRFFGIVRDRWPATSPDRAAFHVLALQMEQTGILQNLGTDLAQAFEKAIDESFSRQLSPALTSIDETLDRVASQVRDEQVEALDEMAAAFQDRLFSSVGEQFDELASTIQEATEWQQRVTNDVGTLFEQVTEISETNTRLLENSSQAAERFLSSLDSLSESHEQLTEVSRHLEEVATRTASLSQQLESESEVFTDANEEIRQELARQLDLVEKQVASMSSFWEQMHGSLNELSSSLSQSLTEFTAITEEKLGEVFHRFDSEMGTVVEHLGGTLAELRDVTEELKPTVERVQQGLDQTLEPLSESRDDVVRLTQSIQRLEALPSHLEEASTEMETARKALIRLGERIEALDGRLGDGTETDGSMSTGDREPGGREPEADEKEDDHDSDTRRPWQR